MFGKVYLIGAGCGDAELITVKGMNLIKDADVIIYDQLANPTLLKNSKENCEKIFVGKMAGNHTLTQDKINELLVEKAKKFTTVVRLKGGDPYVFGRGGEEGKFLFENNIRFETVPGITSAIGGLAYSGIPITHRNISTDFHVYTGHFKDESSKLDFENIAKLKGTLVFLMGVSNIDKIMNGLIKNGKNPDTPCAIIRNASLPTQSTWTCSLKELSDTKIKNNIKPPSLIVIGNVVKVREKLNFFEEKDLFGKKIIVTRSRTQNSELLRNLSQMGAEVFESPVIKVEKINNEILKKEIEKLNDYNYLIFTSENGVNIFFEELNKKYDSRIFFGKKIVSIGKGTSKALKKHGISADIVPEKYVGEELVKILKNEIKSGDRVLLPRAFDARTLILDEISKLCFVKEIKTYKTVIDIPENIDKIKRIIEDGEVDYITFTSSSTVNNFFKMIKGISEESISKIKILSIGPITTNTIKEWGYIPSIEAKEHSIEGMVSELLKNNKISMEAK